MIDPVANAELQIAAYAPPDVARALDQLLLQVPPGRVTTCGALAEGLGSRHAAIWVGHHLLHHCRERGLPCHRVVRATGAIAPYAGDDPQAIAGRLRGEGVPFDGLRAALSACRFDAFQSDRPLARLTALQAAAARELRQAAWPRLPECVAGVDVAYPTPDLAQAAYVLIDVASGELCWSTVARTEVRFPYIRTYLSFRELPAMMAVLAAARREGRLAPLVVVDGSGVLHPRGLGIAAHLGVAADVPTIGVMKKLLCGAVDIVGMSPHEMRSIFLQGVEAGIAIRPNARSQASVFVSPGQGVDLAAIRALLPKLSRGRALPEPIYWADRLSRSR